LFIVGDAVLLRIPPPATVAVFVVKVQLVNVGEADGLLYIPLPVLPVFNVKAQFVIIGEALSLNIPAPAFDGHVFDLKVQLVMVELEDD